MNERSLLNKTLSSRSLPSSLRYGGEDPMDVTMDDYQPNNDESNR
jgi:hypothetical protein